MSQSGRELARYSLRNKNLDFFAPDADHADHASPFGLADFCLSDEGFLVYRQIDAVWHDDDCTVVLRLGALDEGALVELSPAAQGAQVGAGDDFRFCVGRRLGRQQFAVDEFESAFALRQLLLPHLQFEGAGATSFHAVGLHQDSAAFDGAVEGVIHLSSSRVDALLCIFRNGDLDVGHRVDNAAVLRAVFTEFSLSDLVFGHEMAPFQVEMIFVC